LYLGYTCIFLILHIIYFYDIRIRYTYYYFLHNYTINWSHLHLLTTYCLCLVVAGEKKLPRFLQRVHCDVIFSDNMVHTAHSVYNKSHRIFNTRKGSKFISQWTSHGHHRNFNGCYIMVLANHFFIVSISK